MFLFFALITPTTMEYPIKFALFLAIESVKLQFLILAFLNPRLTQAHPVHNFIKAHHAICTQT